MKKFYSLLVIALVAVMAFTLFAACGDMNNPPDKGGDETTGGEKQPIQVEGKVFAFDRTEASVIPGKEAALEAYIAEMGNPEIATVDDFFEIYGCRIRRVVCRREICILSRRRIYA